MCNTRPGRDLINISSASNSSSADSSDMLLAVLFLIRAMSLSTGMRFVITLSSKHNGDSRLPFRFL